LRTVGNTKIGGCEGSEGGIYMKYELLLLDIFIYTGLLYGIINKIAISIKLFYLAKWIDFL